MADDKKASGKPEPEPKDADKKASEPKRPAPALDPMNAPVVTE